MEQKVYECDVLCVGGGIAGLMAGIKAAESGAKTIVAEKGNTKSSGSGRAGNDHFWVYIPEVHGNDVDYYIRECMLTQLGGICRMLSADIVRTWMNRSLEIVNMWDKWGIPMKYNGDWEFAGHSFPGHPMNHIKYSGKDQKKVLTREALARGAEIVNRVMVFDLLGDHRGVTGAIGIDTRDDVLVIFKAKTVILGTGMSLRMFPGITPANMGNDTSPFTLTGDGRVMAYRAGAELIDAEQVTRHIGIKNFARCGQATWIGVYRGPDGKPLGPYTSKPDKKYGDILPEVDKQLFARINQQAKGPVYYDCAGLSEDDYQYMRYWMINEGQQGLLDYLDSDNIDPRKTAPEFMTYNTHSASRIWANEKAETSIPGLYATGDEAQAEISGAAVFGWIAAENAIKYAKSASLKDISASKKLIDSRAGMIDAIQNRKEGYDWRDANSALQHCMQDYAGMLRSESMLQAGLKHLGRLRAKIDASLLAANRWELTRCIETLNLYDLAEVVYLSAIERKESRALHQRADFPMTDPTLNDKVLAVKKIDGRVTFEWKTK
jgi:succinate dehydrogenase/fumarate reductase flavoprotein subunit